MIRFVWEAWPTDVSAIAQTLHYRASTVPPGTQERSCDKLFQNSSDGAHAVFPLLREAVKSSSECSFLAHACLPGAGNSY